MTVSPTTYSAFATSARSYLKHLQGCFSDNNLATIELLAEALRQAWIDGRHVYICGNGGRAANAIHIANDFLYGSGGCGPGPQLTGIRVEALPANSGVITCLANDTGYDNIYAHQLKVKGRKGDLLIVHGALDDNCHYQTFEKLIDRLVSHNKKFSMMTYPRGTHSIREGKNTTIHLYNLMTEFLKSKL